MAETRIVSRREPIVIEVGGDIPDFVAEPLPWRRRNDLGVVIRDAFNAAVGIVRAMAKDKEADADAPEVPMFESLMDYPKVGVLCYPTRSAEDFEALTFDALIAVLGAALDVNGLERVKDLLDPGRSDLPNAVPPTVTLVPEPIGDGQKMESSPA